MELDEEGVRGVLADADGVLATDGHGNLTVFEGELNKGVNFCANLDLVVGAISQLGQQQEAGDLDLAMVTFKNRIMIIACRPGGGHVAVVAPAEVKPGLLLSHVRRLIGQDHATTRAA